MCIRDRFLLAPCIEEVKACSNDGSISINGSSVSKSYDDFMPVMPDLFYPDTGKHGNIFVFNPLVQIVLYFRCRTVIGKKCMPLQQVSAGVLFFLYKAHRMTHLS